MLELSKQFHGPLKTEKRNVNTSYFLLLVEWMCSCIFVDYTVLKKYLEVS